MGTFLSTPITDHCTDEGSRADGVSFGVSAMQGWRCGMEDAHLTNLNFHDQLAIFGVFDGHGGAEVAKFCAAHLCDELKKIDPSLTEAKLGLALQSTFLRLDELLSTSEGISELKAFSKEANGQKKKSVHKINMAEAAEAAQACGLTVAQIQAIIASQLGAKIKLAEQEDEEDAPPQEESVAGENDEDKKQDQEDDHTEDQSQEDDQAEGEFYIELGGGAPSSPSSDEEGGRPKKRRSGVGVESGATAVVAVLSDSQVVVANAGDSRCVLARNGKAFDLSEDHKPEDEVELSRIQKAGGSVVDGRIEGNLNLSRAIGDLFYKQNELLDAKDQMITAFPDITTTPLQANDDFLVLACDGIWNSLTSDEVISFVYDRLNEGHKLGDICELMCDECLAPDTDNDGTGCDNMTMMVVMLPAGATKYPVAQQNKRKQSDEDLSSDPPSKCQKQG